MDTFKRSEKNKPRLYRNPNFFHYMYVLRFTYDNNIDNVYCNNKILHFFYIHHVLQTINSNNSYYFY